MTPLPHASRPHDTETVNDTPDLAVDAASSTAPAASSSGAAPAPPPTSARSTTRNDPRTTPAMRQYFGFKQAHPGCLLLFRMGDFYECFDEDAVTAHRVLGITLTQRSAGLPMAGVPFHAIEGYLRRLVEQGHRVAICEQVEDPAQAKGIVERAVTRVLTPGTLVDELLLDEGRPNYLGALALRDESEGISGVLALAEISTGLFTLHRLPPGQVIDELARLAPAELLHVETSAIEPGPHDAVALLRSLPERLPLTLTARPAWNFRARDAVECLRRQFGVATLAGFGLDETDPALSVAGALLRYLEETQAPAAEAGPASARLAHLRPPRLVERSLHLAIDGASLRSLEVERTMRSGSTEGSLIAALQQCRTPMGKRLLRQWLCFPLCNRPAIEARQRCVAALVGDRDFAARLDAHLSGVQDIARIAARTALGRATPRDLVALAHSTLRLAALVDELADRPAFASETQRLAGSLAVVGTIAREITARCVESPPAHMREGGLMRDGVDALLDEARLLQRDAGAWLSQYQVDLVERTRIPSLRVGFNRVFGYYIEVTNTHGAKVPSDFIRRQTLRGAERYITPELKNYEDKVLSAESRALDRERALFAELCEAAAAAVAAFADAAERVATIDTLASFAETAVRHRYVQPEIVDEPCLRIVQGRHPVLDRTLAERFVPNDCVLRGAHDHNDHNDPNDPGRSPSPEEQASLALITGPNMAGKSTFIRQVALICLLAHTGSFVPADAAVIGLCDRIFTRIGAADELHLNQSTFMVEMTETANILHHATPRSLVVLDEIGRGTSTLDGLSLAWAIAETLARTGCRTLFATHYHELTGLADRMPEVRNLQVAVREWNDEIVFLHHIVPGRTDRSYGIHVAKLAGLPRETVARAETLLETLAVQTEPHAIDPMPVTRPPNSQLGLFTEYLNHPVVDRLRVINVERLSPLESFDLLRALVDEVRKAR